MNVIRHRPLHLKDEIHRRPLHLKDEIHRRHLKVCSRRMMGWKESFESFVIAFDRDFDLSVGVPNSALFPALRYSREPNFYSDFVASCC
jgi:hypothetical protein